MGYTIHGMTHPHDGIYFKNMKMVKYSLGW